MATPSKVYPGTSHAGDSEVENIADRMSRVSIAPNPSESKENVKTGSAKVWNPKTFVMALVKMANKVYASLGDAQTEKMYQKAFVYELKKLGFSCDEEVEISVMYDGVQIGSRRADVVVQYAEASRCVLELKWVKQMTTAHLKQLKYYMAQLKIPMGVLLNFPKGDDTFPALEEEIDLNFKVTAIHGATLYEPRAAKKKTNAVVAPEVFLLRNPKLRSLRVAKQTKDASAA